MTVCVNRPGFPAAGRRTIRDPSRIYLSGKVKKHAEEPIFCVSNAFLQNHTDLGIHNVAPT